MRKVFLDDLPKKYGFGANKNKLVIDWEKCIGQKVKFIYEDIEGEIKIINYQNYYLTIQYNNKIFDIFTGSFKKCSFGSLLLSYHDYKYNINEIIQNKYGKIQILQQFRAINKDYRKTYKYKCLTCGNIDIITESELEKNLGCNVCSHRKPLKGINDIWTTNPTLAKLLANPEDGYKYMQHSSKEIDWKCPNCGNIIKNKKINDINKQGLSCSKCSDGVSYPNKFMYSILEQLHIDCKTELSRKDFKWIDKYRYDFYFLVDNIPYILEANGLQHYEYTGFKRTLEEEQINDRFKKELALQNGIKKENYIIIDCRKSELDFIKNNILNSRLNEIFDLSQINWMQCEKFACNSLVKQACDLWNIKHKMLFISKKMQLHKDTIRKYLKQGTKLGWCNYNAKEEMKKIGRKHSKKNKKQIICLNMQKIFNSIADASNTYNINRSHIGECCRKKLKSAGKHPITGEPLKWMYYNDYIKLKNNINILHNKNNISA